MEGLLIAMCLALGAQSVEVSSQSTQVARTIEATNEVEIARLNESSRIWNEYVEWLDEDQANGTRRERVLAGVETCGSDSECESIFGVEF